MSVQTEPTETVEQVFVTPEMASEWLSLNVGNRKVREGFVDRLVSAMKRGEWTSSWDMVAFSDGDKRLLNGQHRLLAVVKSGVSCYFWVMHNAPSVAQTTGDGGSKRGLKDALDWLKEPNSSVLASVLVQMFHYEQGDLNSGSACTSAQMFELLEKHPEVRDSIAFCEKYRHRSTLRLNPTVAAFSHYLFSRVDKVDANVFWERVFLGEGLVSGSGPLMLRRLFEREMIAERKTPRLTQLAWTVKAWNAWREGRSVRQLAWRAGGDNPEGFPVPV